MNFLILRYFYFLKMWLIFVCSVDNFGRSDDEKSINNKKVLTYGQLVLKNLERSLKEHRINDCKVPKCNCSKLVKTETKKSGKEWIFLMTILYSCLSIFFYEIKINRTIQFGFNHSFFSYFLFSYDFWSIYQAA